MSAHLVKVLLVDDDYEDFLLTKDFLGQIESVKFEIGWANSFENAVRELDSNLHDIYLVDYYLGEHNGLMLLEEASRRHCKAPIIILTGKGDYNTDLKVMASGAADYLEKSQIDPQMLERSIRYALERKRAREEMAYRLELEKLITTISTTFINLSHEELDAGINEALELVGRFAGLDRCFIVSIDDNECLNGVSHSWEREGISPPAPPSPLALAELPLIRQNMLKRESLYIPHSSGASSELRRELDGISPSEAASLVAIPLAYSRSMFGILRLDSLSRERNWKDEDLALVSMLGTVFVNAFGRQRAEDESRRLQKQLAQVQKMEAVGQLAAGIAHDLNNALAITVGHLELMKAMAPPDSPVNESVAIASDGCQRAVVLVSQLMGFAKQGKYDPKPLSAAHVINDTLRYISRPLSRNTRKIDGNIEVSIETGPENLTIYGDERQISQAMTSVMMHAKSGLREGGHIKLRLERARILHPEGSNPSAKPGEFAVISISDDGKGIPRDQLDKVFDPFFGLGSDERTSGLGLATAYGITHNHGGWAEVESELGHGTTVKLVLPLHNGAGAERPSH